MIGKRLMQALIEADETAETVSGAMLRDALEHGFDSALAGAHRESGSIYKTDLERRMFNRGYDALSCEPTWLETNR